jgi:hypothetical protein
MSLDQLRCVAEERVRCLAIEALCPEHDGHPQIDCWGAGKARRWIRERIESGWVPEMEIDWATIEAGFRQFNKDMPWVSKYEGSGTMELGTEGTLAQAVEATTGMKLLEVELWKAQSRHDVAKRLRGIITGLLVGNPGDAELENIGRGLDAALSNLAEAERQSVLSKPPHAGTSSYWGNCMAQFEVGLEGAINQLADWTEQKRAKA